MGLGIMATEVSSQLRGSDIFARTMKATWCFCGCRGQALQKKKGQFALLYVETICIVAVEYT